ncbi:indole-3-glycerol phosphate synthase TrpC [Bacillus sp. B1-b2]|uniref:indole-3-glycerol phosphate synthase TrpC n=1 Tax=Bacillus sp. B1-b2 TaxID=2653201 RepID=UPI001D02B1D2|nr:indole-3-glycerol phosphate synthase TrpC [Bacillus sp. B1-b2]
MMTILDTIIAEKHQVVKELYDRKKELTFEEKSSIKRSLIARLEKNTNLSIIAEFKRASPSKGDINIHLDPEQQAKQYEQFGADAISVLTDTPFFKGTYQDLEAVRKAVNVPILCKDFIIDTIQIDFAKHYGADIILLIAAALDDDQLQKLYNYATEKELEVLLEVHNEDELQRALKTNAKLIGVNNRNLKTFEVTLDTTEQLAALIKENNRYLVSESGISSLEDVERVTASGAKAILVGETFMRATDLEQTLSEMKVSLKV